MSVGLNVAPAATGSPWMRRLGLMALAIAAATLLVALLTWLIAPGLASPPPRSPFGIGFREAAPSATGLGGVILSLQASFARAMNGAVMALKGGGDWTPLVGLAFAYGVFHAAGPGHGKAVIAGYILAGERAFRRGCVLSVAAALLQAFVAMALVGIGSLILNATAATMTRAGTFIETVSFALVAAAGLTLTWRKAGQLAGDPAATGCGPDCAHIPSARTAAEAQSLREWAGIVLAAGSRPCAGAVLVLVFALSQGVASAGVLAVFAMAAGTALTTTALAALAVFAKRAALALAGGRGQVGARAVGGLELLAAAFVLVLGVAMLAGLATGVGG